MECQAEFHVLIPAGVRSARGCPGPPCGVAVVVLLPGLVVVVGGGGSAGVRVGAVAGSTCSSGGHGHSPVQPASD